MEQKFLKVLKNFPEGGHYQDEIMAEATEQKLRLNRKYIDKVVDETRYTLLGVDAPWLCPVKRGSGNPNFIIYREFVTRNNYSVLSHQFSADTLQKTFQENRVIPLLDQNILSFLGERIVEESSPISALQEKFPQMDTNDCQTVLDIMVPHLFRVWEDCHNNPDRFRAKIQKFERGTFERFKWWGYEREKNNEGDEGNERKEGDEDEDDEKEEYDPTPPLFYQSIIQPQVQAFFYPNLTQANELCQSVVKLRTKYSQLFREEIPLIYVEYVCLTHFQDETKLKEELTAYHQRTRQEEYPNYLPLLEKQLNTCDLHLSPQEIYKFWFQCGGDKKVVDAVLQKE